MNDYEAKPDSDQELLKDGIAKSICPGCHKKVFVPSDLAPDSTVPCCFCQTPVGLQNTLRRDFVKP